MICSKGENKLNVLNLIECLKNSRMKFVTIEASKNIPKAKKLKTKKMVIEALKIALERQKLKGNKNNFAQPDVQAKKKSKQRSNKNYAFINNANKLKITIETRIRNYLRKNTEIKGIFYAKTKKTTKEKRYKEQMVEI